MVKNVAGVSRIIPNAAALLPIMAHTEDHPLSPLAEALEWGVARGAAYFFAWLLGINLPRMVEWVLLGDINGRPGAYADGPAAGVLMQQEAGQDQEVIFAEEYDHSYYFIATFIKEHIDHHAKYLK